MNSKNRVGRVIAGVVALGWGVAPGGARAGENCFSIVQKPASTVCQAAFDCECPGGGLNVTTIDVSGARVGVTAKSGGGTDNCCRVLIAVPAHHQLVPGPFEVLPLTVVPGRIYSGGCTLECTSILFGLATWGTAICSYDDGADFGAYELYKTAGTCPVERG